MSTSDTQTRTIEGMAIQKAGDLLTPFTYEAPALGPWDIEVEITHCGICHSDLHLIKDDWGFSQFPMVPGHEIIGFVRRKGAEVVEFELGQRVGIGWQRSSCQHCESCHRGEGNLCLDQEATCVGHFGGFAKEIVADSRYAFAIPQELASENAAPLLCGGATVYSPLNQYANPNMSVGVIGVGGLGHLAVQFAVAFGCEVYAFSTSPDKEEEVKEYGAHHFLSSSDPKEIAKAKGKIDLLLCTSSEHMDWAAFLATLKPKGRLCQLGVPKGGHIDVKIFDLIDGRKSICGSNIAGPPDINAMLAFAARHNIVAKTELFKMSDVNIALEKLAKNQIKYRVVLEN